MGAGSHLLPYDHPMPVHRLPTAMLGVVQLMFYHHCTVALADYVWIVFHFYLYRRLHHPAPRRRGVSFSIPVPVACCSTHCHWTLIPVPAIRAFSRLSFVPDHSYSPLRCCSAVVRAEHTRPHTQHTRLQRSVLCSVWITYTDRALPAPRMCRRRLPTTVA